MRKISHHIIVTAFFMVTITVTAHAQAQFSNRAEAVTTATELVTSIAAQPGTDEAVRKASFAYINPLETELLALLTQQLKNEVAAGLTCDSAQTCSGATAIAATSQTQIQNGATSTSNGSTSATQLPAIPALLGLAIERGAITNDVSGNTMSLSTNLYAMVASFAGDTAPTYRACGHCSQIGGSATFNLTDTSDPLQQATRRQITQWQVKYAFRDVSSRSKKALDLYSDVANAARNAVRDLLDPTFLPLHQQLDAAGFDSLVVDATIAEINATGKAKAALTPADKDAIARKLLARLDANAVIMKVYQDALNNPALADKARLYATAIRAFLLLKTRYAKNLTYLSNGWNGAATFGQQYPTTTITAGSTTLTQPTYLAGTLVLSYKPGPKPKSAEDLKSEPAADSEISTSLRPALTFNAGGTFYPKPVVSANEQTFRGGTAALQLQWSIDKRPFSHDPLDKSQTTISLNGNYTRVQENKHQSGKKADIALGNFKLEIPIAGGVTLPLSFTVANSSERIKESYVRGNFGLSFDLDKFSALLKAKN